MLQLRMNNAIIPVLLLAAFLATPFGSLARVPEPTVFTVETATAVSTSLPPDFASFSVEIYCAKTLLSYDGTGAPRTSYLNLVGYLRNASRSSRGPNLRIGGDSSDHTIYRENCSGVPLPSGITYCASPADLAAFEYFATINGTITVGLNLGFNVVAEAVNYARAVSENVRPGTLVEAYEIGNEPDLFALNGLRSFFYNFTGYSDDFRTWFDALRSGTSITFPAIQGAVFCCDLDFFDLGLDAYMREYESKGFFRSVSYHHYPLIACGKNVVTLEELLQPSAAHSVRFYAPFAAVSRGYNRPFYVGEGNSVSCGGALNVSNTFGAALWAVDALFNAASSNITRWNFHGCESSSYSPVWLSAPSGSTDERYAMAQPLFYGMWAFTWMIAGEAKVLSVSAPGADPAIVVWSARSDSWSSTGSGDGDSSCAVRIATVVLDKRFSNNATAAEVAIKFDGLSSAKGKNAVVRRMVPASGGVLATGDISFGGLTFEGSTDGLPLGQSNTTTVELSSDATIVIVSDPGSATFVEVYDGCV